MNRFWPITLFVTQPSLRKCVPIIRHLSYPQRLEHLKRFSLRKRRLSGNLIETFEIIHGFVLVDPTEFFFLLS